MKISRTTVEATKRSLLQRLVLVLEVLAARAEESFSRTSVNTWGKKVHWGTLRLSVLSTG
jgi:hypothetical protein